MGLDVVQALFQLRQPGRRQVHVLEQNPTTSLAGGLQCLLGLLEALGRADGDRGHLLANVQRQVLHPAGGIVAGGGAEQDRHLAGHLLLDHPDQVQHLVLFQEVFAERGGDQQVDGGQEPVRPQCVHDHELEEGKRNLV